MHSISGIWKSSSLLIALIAAILTFSAPASATIIVQGNSRSDAETIRSYFTGSSPEEVEKGMEALRESGAGRVVSADCGCLLNIAGRAQRMDADEGRAASLPAEHLASFLWRRTGSGEA